MWRRVRMQMSPRARPDIGVFMIRFFDMFLGRSTTMRALDDALRAAGLHPLLMPEPVKLTVIQLTKRHAAAQAQETAFADAAQLLAYCMLGHEQFADSNSSEEAGCADQRVEAAMDEGDTLDAKLILLAYHAGLISPEVADRVDVDETETDQA
ncbi:hypothetical protein LY39_03704 [Roseinatronobacter bogoriensis subsp. barguzinensis]|nr:hypothetical protein LY39_03704 [Rhodobaca barguzinensis]TDY65681.1 hypothetical protein EV660_11828 [Rhodobaca bogoriensis DSM 18756]